MRVRCSIQGNVPFLLPIGYPGGMTSVTPPGWIFSNFAPGLPERRACAGAGFPSADVALLAHFPACVENEVRMIREFSSGALVLRHMQRKWYVAVIEPGRDGEPDDRKNVVALPKGNIDGGETPERAAVREVLEETGIDARPVASLGSIRYVYSRKWKDGKKIFKVVTFHLMKYHSGRIGEITPGMRHEVRRAWWMPLRIAPTRLSYEGEREMARKAVAYVKSHPRDF